MEFLFEILGELLLQVFGELLVEIGLQALVEPFRRDPDPWLAAIGYLLLGGIAGGLSLLVVPHHLTPAGLPRLANLVFTPLLAGGLMALIGRWRAQRGDRVLRIDRFAHGTLFALALALIRYRFAA